MQIAHEFPSHVQRGIIYQERSKPQQRLLRAVRENRATLQPTSSDCTDLDETVPPVAKGKRKQSGVKRKPQPPPDNPGDGRSLHSTPKRVKTPVKSKTLGDVANSDPTTPKSQPISPYLPSSTLSRSLSSASPNTKLLRATNASQTRRVLTYGQSK